MSAARCHRSLQTAVNDGVEHAICRRRGVSLQRRFAADSITGLRTCVISDKISAYVKPLQRLSARRHDKTVCLSINIDMTKTEGHL